jgi:hypothetical protein
VLRLTQLETLNGGELLPGFSCRVAELFLDFCSRIICLGVVSRPATL